MSAAEFEEFEELEDLDALDQPQGPGEEVLDDAMAASATAGDVRQGALAESSAEADEVKTSDSPAATAISSRLAWLSTMTVYDAMLLTSLITISLACLLMLTELFSFGFPFFQWRTGAPPEPLTPPV